MPEEVANDAQLVQVVRSYLGRDARTRGRPRPNVSSCGRIVTLHGVARNPAERTVLEEAARRVPGVQGVVNKLGIADGRRG